MTTIKEYCDKAIKEKRAGFFWCGEKAIGYLIVPGLVNGLSWRFYCKKCKSKGDLT